METALKINVPEGYEIDREKSTFENIVFKKNDDTVIKWNKQYGSVDIIADGEKFRIDAVHPSFYCSWNDAKKYFKDMVWKLPTVKQLKVLAKYHYIINDIIRENNGYTIHGWLWSSEDKNEFHAWNIHMASGFTDCSYKGNDKYVRAVNAL